MLNHKIRNFIAAAGAICALNTGCATQSSYAPSANDTGTPGNTATSPVSQTNLSAEQAQALAQKIGLFRNPDDHFPLATVRQSPGLYDVDVRGGCDSTRLTIETSLFNGSKVTLDEFLCHGRPDKGPMANITTVTSFPFGTWELSQSTLGAETAPTAPNTDSHKQHVRHVVGLILEAVPPTRGQNIETPYRLFR